MVREEVQKDIERIVDTDYRLQKLYMTQKPKRIEVFDEDFLKELNAFQDSSSRGGGKINKILEIQWSCIFWNYLRITYILYYSKHLLCKRKIILFRAPNGTRTKADWLLLMRRQALGREMPDPPK